jgi:hypothetical protein
MPLAGHTYALAVTGGMKRMKRVEKNEKELGGSTCIYLFSQGSRGSINLISITSPISIRTILFSFSV